MKHRPTDRRKLRFRVPCPWQEGRASVALLYDGLGRYGIANRRSQRIQESGRDTPVDLEARRALEVADRIRGPGPDDSIDDTRVQTELGKASLCREIGGSELARIPGHSW